MRTIARTNYTVARVGKITKSSAGKFQRHNERENENYGNINVDTSMSYLNVHYKSPEGKSYNEVFDELVSQKVISTRGLKEDATRFDELLLDVNTTYFEERGGYDYAKEFFAEAYEFAKNLYGEDKIVSAVMHADEINEAVTAELGRPVYHYHLHVIAIPTVEKEVKWSKRNKDPELRGKVKEVITQVSHSKMWKSEPKLDDKGGPILNKNGKPALEKSYSVLQDKFFDHMREAGFKDFERGERGSSADHLSVLDFKIKKDTERLNEINKNLEVSAEFGEKAGEFKKTIDSIEDIGEKAFLGNKIKLTEEEFVFLRDAAGAGLAAQAQLKDQKELLANKDWIIEDQSRTISGLKKTVVKLENTIAEWKEKYEDLKEKCEPYLIALKKFPEKAKEFVETIKEKINEEKQTAAWQEAAGRVRKRYKSRDDMER